MATLTEVERKYEVPAGFTVPDLSRVPAVAAVRPTEEHRLDATYYDTVDLRLAAHRTTLRHRSGGHDAGWHVKRPAGADRTETHVPAGAPDVGIPAAVTTEVADVTGGAALIPVAHIRTRRVELPLCGADGTVLALIADDHVTTESLGAVRRWREVEVELVQGPRALLDAVDGALRAAGAWPSTSPSKLARALGDRYPGARSDPAGAAVADYLRAQRAAIRDTEVGVRAGDPDAVHDMRVAIRRLRSTLRTFRAVLDAARTEPIRAELRWLAGLLGAVRDGDVLADRLTAALAELPAEAVVGPVAQRVHDRLTARTGTARDELLVAMDGARYRTLLGAVDMLVADPLPVPPSRAAVLRRVRKALRRADRQLAQARTDAALHEARKAYKRARYAVEAMARFHEAKARRLTTALTRLQDVLGAHQDAIGAAAVVRDLARTAANGFTYGVLYQGQRTIGQLSLRALPRVTRKATRKKVRRWLRDP